VLDDLRRETCLGFGPALATHGDPGGIRTRVTDLRRRRARPLHYGAVTGSAGDLGSVSGLAAGVQLSGVLTLGFAAHLATEFEQMTGLEPATSYLASKRSTN
jgi:hypothetical protein